ncbi:endonuclease VII domain-containing protein [Sphingomonas hankookensis]|uniref:endonuclease VII domain-containing protein n=1 Tax=Sphingomonas hankookensis TaxID=563996 RepID=UPI003D303D4B
MQSERCKVCDTALNDSTWSPSMQKYGRRVCRSCWTARQKRYQDNPVAKAKKKAATKARMKAQTDAERDRHSRVRYNAWLKRRYGITLERYETMLSAQNGCCAICKGGKNGRGKFHVDHCHSSGAIRGLLCAKCNLLLGHANDDAELLRTAAKYLAVE